MARTTSLSGKIVLITGAARGMGAETAKAVVARGGKVALVGLEPERLAALAASLGDAAAWFEADVADADAVQRAASGAVTRFGGLDIVLSNAGIGAFGTLATIDPAQFARVMSVNFMGTWNVMRATLPQLVARRGYFLANASISAALGMPGMGAYAASKAATESLCDTLRQEVSHRGVDVGVAYFSWIDTDLVATAETHPAFAFLRARLPGIVRATSPVAVAVAALVDGMQRRMPRIITTRALRVALGLRWPLALQAAKLSARTMPEVDRLCAEAIASYGGAERVPSTDPRQPLAARA